ncbi:MAG: DNA mismatch repair endonuclease MutL [Desulforhopalus sp.]|nr:DNA mismatch repair endonuclease MutL [Desulforhopalus sp.]
MAKIRILPEQLANQIAAGEVVERPASVVKELLENSLDAGASRIEVEIEGGGTRLIRIIDNGAGMDEDDLLLCLERHGTSKLATEKDLTAIATLGFRGEAIPSIGSVSELTITSRPAEAALGSRVVLQYGKLTKAHETGCGYGTTCEVRNLFGNTPARRKFLRSARTELSHIEEVIKNYALSSPSTTFILRIDGRETVSLDRTLSVAERLAVLLHYEGRFIEIGKGEKGPAGHEVSGFLLPPEKVTIGPARLRIFVNGRIIRDRMIVHAVTEGMRSFLMKGKNPSGLIHLTLPPSEVDVNVHPAKHEVRFRSSKEVHQLVLDSVAKAMRDQQDILKMTIFATSLASEPRAIPFESGTTDESPGNLPDPLPRYGTSDRIPAMEMPGASLSTEKAVSVTSRPASAAAARSFAEHLPTSGPSHEPAQSPRPQSLLATAEPLPSPSRRQEDTPPSKEAARQQPQAPAHNLLVIGQYDNLYIFCRNSEGLLVIDQHAAHERLLFEKLHNQYQKAAIARQNLMFPVSVELSLFQARLVEKFSEEIDRMGFSIRDFGGNTYIISAIPALAGTTNPLDLFLNILEKFGSEDNSSDRGGCLDTILATMACKAAVKAGTELTPMEIDKLLGEMAKADLFSHCPHGRPVVRQFSREEIKKWFYRT